RLFLPAAQGDAVVEEDAARTQQRVGLAEVQRQHLAADVLEHADADQLVERARYLAIILILDAAAILQAGLANALLSELHLLAAQGDAERVDAVLLCRVHHQTAPAAADVQ